MPCKSFLSLLPPWFVIKSSWKLISCTDDSTFIDLLPIAWLLIMYDSTDMIAYMDMTKAQGPIEASGGDAKALTEAIG